MRLRPLILILLGLLVLAAAWFFWPSSHRGLVQKNQPPQSAVSAPGFASIRSASTAPVLFAGKTATNSVARTNQFAWRLSNTPKTIGQLVNDPHAILLENALIEVGSPLNFSIPKNLQSSGDPGAYIVQARGPVDGAFRATLAAAGAQIVSYIPNNAYLVRISSGGAAGLSGRPQVQSVIPYEPYYKISSALIGAAVQQESLPGDSALTLGLFADNAQPTIDQIEKLGGTVVGTDRSPFGPIVRVIPPANWTALATLPGVQIVELAHRRAPANDLARVTLGISVDTVTNANYRGLSGSNVLVEVNDTGIDATHPDFSATGTAETGPSGAPRVLGLPFSLVDVNGHGTHVAGIIAGNGSESYSLTNIPQGSVTNADFRGKAPAASLYSFAALDNAGIVFVSDSDLQTVPATNHALISNNSWTYDGDNSYNLSAASYDAAVRDALPLVTGSQPVLFVFAAGNDGGGDGNGGGGDPDTILSPGTAKDVVTVGALEQERGITNTFTPLDTTNQVAPWTTNTDNSDEVADYSARGNVGIGTEGTFGRFKPDVVAPGSFVISTRPPDSMWDQMAYYNPTNFYFNGFSDQLVAANGFRYYSLAVPGNAVGVTITLTPTGAQPFPTNMWIYVKQSDYPDPSTASFDFATSNNMVSIPPDGGAAYLTTILTNGFFYAIGNPTNVDVSYNITTEITTTNDLGNYFEVLSNLNGTLAPYYRYESGTSMAAPAISGSLALFQDYFTNQIHPGITLSPALLKALLINGARAVGNYNFVVTNAINYQGWGLANVPNSLPFGLNNNFGVGGSSFFLDQSPTNALATGASQSFTVTYNTNSTTAALSLPLRVTLAWTDPPGNPAAAIKLVNNLDLMVSNNITGDVFFGNDIPFGSIYNSPWNTNFPPNLDPVNNVENVFLSSAASGSYTVTVLGTSVNVNAVTAQTNNAAGVYAPNVVQDYALVISSGDGEVTNAITVAELTAPPLAVPQVTYVATTNELLMNQLAGGNTPLIGTNTVGAGAGYITNAVITVGMTNQWHFFVVTNVLGFTNGAFITLLSQTLATPRMGVFADPTQNPTQPDADIDLYVASLTTDPNAYALTNLDPNVISNCVHGVNGDGASLANGTGTEFVAYTNSQMNQIYYIAVKSETQVAAEFDFLPVFSLFPFSEMDANGNEIVNGLLLPVGIPDGSPAHPGVAHVFALAVQPIQIEDVIVSNQITHQNLGDLVGALQHNDTSVVLNNHNSDFNLSGIYDFIYDQSPQPVAGSQPPDGPGTLTSFQGQQGTGPWILTEVDNSLTQTGSVTGFTLLIRPHLNLLNNGVNVPIAANSWFYGFIDVPAGATNLTVSATNVLSVVAFPPLQMFIKLGDFPTLTNFDKSVFLTNGAPPGGTITVGPSDLPPIQPGRYYVGIYNGSLTPYSDVFVIASIALGQVPQVNFGSGGPTNLPDDAVTYSSVFVTNTLPIATIGVGLRVDHPRISDLVFHLISPDGTRYLLMENRGAETTNGCGVTIFTTNIVNASAAGGSAANTNFIFVGTGSGTLTINYNFYPAPDQMTVYASTNPSDFYLTSPTLILNTGFIPNSGQLNIPFTTSSGYLTIIMNQFGNTDTNTIWNYSAGGVQTNFYYLVLTQDTNLTTTPIKFAPPPFVSSGFYSTNFALSDFEAAAPGDYVAPLPVTGTGWSVLNNQVSVVNDPADAYQGSQFLALANGVISNNIPTVPGGKYTLNYAYRGPGIISWWRGENNTLDSLSANNGLPVGALGYASGEVANAFSLDGSSSYVQMPNSSSLNPPGGFSIEGWIYLTNDVSQQSMILGKWGDQGAYANNRTYQLSATPGLGLEFSISDLANQGNNGFQQINVGGVLTLNAWNHVAATYDSSSGIRRIYANGANVLTVAKTPTSVYASITPVTIGAWLRQPGTIIDYFNGRIDEVSLYNRTLSDSEIKAIYTDGTNGKFNPNQFNNSPAQSLAEASITIPGVTTDLIFGDNTNWQQQTISFTATGTSTPVVIAGLEPGMLLDSFGVSGAGGGGNLYYLPEQSLDPLVGTSPFGTWQLEIQDDRVGATNHTVLDSWQLQFVFANTNPVPANVGGGITNFIPPGGLAWYEVDVPTNADFATNILTFATGPLNMWFSTNTPPTIVNPGDVEFFANQTNDSETLGTNGSPVNTTSAYMVPGGTYFIGIQNPGGVTVQYGFRVDFHLILPNITNPFAFTEPATLITGTSAQLNGMATPNGAPASAWFEWGSSRAYGITTPPVSVGAGSNVVFVSNNITGLTNFFAFHYRLVVSNAQTVVYGFDQIIDQGNLLAWGADFKGQTTPIPAGLTNLVVEVGAGDDYSLALNYNGTVVVWGDNSQGQTNVPAGLSNAVAVAGGMVDSLALRSDRTVIVWGSNVYGQTNVPPDLTNAIAAASGSYHCLALRDDGNPVAWGSDDHFQTNVPAGLSNVVAVAGGQFHSLALKNDGTVVAWGNNAEGETNVPPGLTNVVAIAAGYSHNLALKDDGTVAAWGFNGNGQTNVPFGLTNVMAIAAGGYHCLALRTDGTVVFWGDSGAGQTNFTPVNLTNVFTIAGGGFHTVAVSALFGLSVTNTPPYWTNGLDSTTVTMSVLTTKVIDNSALDSNAPPQLVFYSFVNNPPPFASINAFTGIITLTPQATDGPSTNIITTVATDNGFPPLSATNRFTLIVTSTNTPPQTNTVPISGIVHTNIGGTNGFLLTWFAPSNDLFQVQWTTSLFPAVWTTFTNPPAVSYNPGFPASSTSAQFNFFDDGSQTGGFGPTRFYRLILLGSGPSPNTPPVLPPQLTQTVNPLNLLVVTNTATDADLPPQTLTYSISSTVTGTNVPTINTNTGVITWTPDVSQAGTSNVITTVVTDNGAPPLSATNSFSVIVNPVPGISSITFTGGGFLLTWFAPTNDIFQVQVATSLALPTVWQTIATNVIYTGPATPTNGLFTYFDDGSQVPFGALRFYRLQLVGITASANTPPMLPPQVTQTVNPLNPLIVTNTATDADLPPQTLTYALTSTVTGTNQPAITANGIITWTPDVSQAGTSNVITTVVTDNGIPPLSATNSFSVIVNPVPGISSITFTGGGFLLTWFAPTNDIFQVQVSTNLASPIVWITFSNLITYTGPLTPTNGQFSFYDDGSQVPFASLRFYRLQLVGVALPATTTVPISNINFTNGGFLLTWFAPTNDQFNVRWATNLAPPVNWSVFPGTITSTNGVFSFMDTNAPLLLKFYDLLLLP